MNKRHFTAKEIEKLKDKYPAVLRLKCHCPKRHRSGCGCMTEMFVKVARKNFSRALHDAGTDPDKFKKRMTALHHHARDIHGWEVTEGGTTVQQICDFHPLFVCSCGSCKKDELTCEGKLYHTSYVLSCRFHALLYKIECDNRSARASDLIHPVFGKGHTSRMESAHSILTVFRPKSWHLFRLHYEVSTNLALLQSNVNYMNSVCGMNYHWLSDLYQRLSIPILEGMEAVLKQVNVRRIKESQQGKTEASKKRRLRCYKKHLGEEQLARQKFGKSLKMSHTYGKTEKLTDDSPRSSLVKAECQTTPSRQVSANEKACRCGSTRHNRRECPFNKQLKKPAFFSGHDDSCHVVEQHASHHNSPLAQTVEEPAVSTVCDSFDDTDDDNQPPQSVPVKAKSRSSPASTNQQPCKCGSTLHSRINHRDCPLNKKLKKPSAHDDGSHVDDRQSSRHNNRKSKKKLLFPASMTAVATMMTLAVAISSQMMTVSIISSIVIFLLLVTMTLVIVTVKMRWKPGQTKTCRQMMSCFPVTVSWVTRERINVTVRLIPVRNGRGVSLACPLVICRLNVKWLTCLIVLFNRVVHCRLQFGNSVLVRWWSNSPLFH